jgi:hypothetical protein
MGRKAPWSLGIALVLCVALAGTALAAITWGPQKPIPGTFSWNYSNSMDLTGTPGTTSFKLHLAFVSDAKTREAGYHVSSKDGVSWSSPQKITGKQNIDGTSLAAAGNSVIVGWQTGYTFYDPNGANRQVQVNYSPDNGGSWKGVTDLSGANGFVDYPVVAAAKTSAGPTNLYVVWVDSVSGKVLFRERSGAGVWSQPTTLGTTTAKILGAAYGYSGYANIAATGDLITVAWISNNKGLLKARTLNLNGHATAATSAANWSATTSLQGNISLKQNGFPIVSASPLRTNVTTIAWNTATKQVYTTANGKSVDPTPITIFANGTAGGRTYTGGYSTTVEPAPNGGYVAGWGSCVDTNLTNDCDYNKNVARFDLLVSTSHTGAAGSWTTPKLLGDSAASRRATLNDEPSIVVVPGNAYSQYNVYNAAYSAYDIYARVGTGNP